MRGESKLGDKECVMVGVNKSLGDEKRVGRPLTIVDGYRVAELRAQGASWREIAGRLAVGATTARRALSRLAKSLPKPPSES
jgi:DNA invertase Pin-like site-specific DNA recombinase